MRVISRLPPHASLIKNYHLHLVLSSSFSVLTERNSLEAISDSTSPPWVYKQAVKLFLWLTGLDLPNNFKCCRKPDTNTREREAEIYMPVKELKEGDCASFLFWQKLWLADSRRIKFGSEYAFQLDGPKRLNFMQHTFALAHNKVQQTSD